MSFAGQPLGEFKIEIFRHEIWIVIAKKCEVDVEFVKPSHWSKIVNEITNLKIIGPEI